MRAVVPSKIVVGKSAINYFIVDGNYRPQFTLIYTLITSTYNYNLIIGTCDKSVYIRVFVLQTFVTNKNFKIRVRHVIFAIKKSR